MFPTPGSIPTAIKTRALRIPNEPNIWGAVYGALNVLTHPNAWEYDGSVSPEDIAAAMVIMVDDMTDYGEAIVIGAIFPYVTEDPPVHCLACDGASYSRVDYPRLYAILDPTFILDADTFFIPDLRSQFVMGAATSGDVGTNGGEATHTLTTAEMPTHSHTNAPHSHTDIGHIHAEGIAAPSAAAAISVAFVPSAVPAIGATASGNASLTSDSITIDSEGDGDPHNNIPPYTALSYCVLAE